MLDAAIVVAAEERAKRSAQRRDRAREHARAARDRAMYHAARGERRLSLLHLREAEVHERAAARHAEALELHRHHAAAHRR